jgi:hypothetical protein
MADKWTITIQVGSQFSQSITISGVADIATASEWRVTIGLPGTTPILTASTANGMIVAGTGANNKTLVIPAATTATLTPGNYRFDFDILWTSPAKQIRYYPLGQCLVQPEVA